MRSRSLRSRLAVGSAAALLVLTAAACGDDDSSSSSPDSTAADGGSSSETLTLGYSAWPGWFPLAVAEQAGIFEDHGLDVDLKFFADYLGSLDAMSAGQLDGNTQTLNDTMFAVASGDEQVIVLTNDNSTGNDAIICDESITSIEQLAGKTIAAEQGVVDHFLLLQGLASKGLTQDDVDFKGVLTDAAASGFAAGEFDCVGVFAPFTLTALERPGSHVLFSSADYPGTISDHIVVTPELVQERPEDVQALVDAWYDTLAYIEAHPAEALKILAEAAQLSEADYTTFADGTTIFTADEALAAFQDGTDTTSLLYTARLINPFLVSSGLSETEAPLDGLFDPSFTQDYVDRQGA